MNKFTSLLFCLVLALSSNAQVTFETLPLPINNYWKGVAAVPTVSGFQDGAAYFVNSYDTSFGGFWSGWGYSALDDTISTSYSNNELGCIAGKGQNGSNAYGVAYVGSNLNANKIKLANENVPIGFYISNTTIAYRSMQNGDAFSKKFGGTTGNDPDYFRLKLTGWRNGIPKPDTVTIYLADFRDTNNVNDYILKDWTYFNTSVLGRCDSLTYFMESSDTSFGFNNTPTYFCIDNMNLMAVGTNDVDLESTIQIYPNPISETFTIQNKEVNSMNVAVYDNVGKIIFQTTLNSHEKKNIQSSNWSQGMYFVKIKINEQSFLKKIIK